MVKVTSCEQLIIALQRHQSPRLLAVLVRIFGAHNLDLAEDVLQDAFCKALVNWQTSGVPKNPSAWLMQTAKHQALDRIRHTRTQRKYAPDLTHFLESEWTTASTLELEFTDHRIKDDQLRMLFMCCHQHISADNRLPFMLKHLCGLSVSAISKALFIPTVTVKKRLLRTAQKFKTYQFVIPSEDALPLALDSVHTALYLLFNEGFHSSSNNKSVDLMLCSEAMGLTDLLIDEARIPNQDTFALLALMHFHTARQMSKVDDSGVAIPIDLQDRSMWLTEHILKGVALLSCAEKLSKLGTGRFYIEAQIAQQHCLAQTFEDTRWGTIETLYQQLYAITGSPVTQLNSAVAKGYCGKLDEAIKLVHTLQQNPIFKHSHLPLATLAHLQALKGDAAKAWELAEQANQQGGEQHEQKVMMSQIQRLLAQQKLI